GGTADGSGRHCPAAAVTAEEKRVDARQGVRPDGPETGPARGGRGRSRWTSRPCPAGWSGGGRSPLPGPSPGTVRLRSADEETRVAAEHGGHPLGGGL